MAVSGLGGMLTFQLGWFNQFGKGPPLIRLLTAKEMGRIALWLDTDQLSRIHAPSIGLHPCRFISFSELLESHNFFFTCFHLFSKHALLNTLGFPQNLRLPYTFSKSSSLSCGCGSLCQFIGKAFPPFLLHSPPLFTAEVYTMPTLKFLF